MLSQTDREMNYEPTNKTHKFILGASIKIQIYTEHQKWCDDDSIVLWKIHLLLTQFNRLKQKAVSVFDVKTFYWKKNDTVK